MASPLARRIAPGALSLALLIGGGLAAVGCSGGGDDISKETFLEGFSEQSPLNPELDQCIVDWIFENLEQEQINSFWGEAGVPLSAENSKALADASAACSTETVEELVPETGTEAEPGTTEAGMGPDTAPTSDPTGTTTAG